MNLALFDFDGTITSSDTWTPFMRLAVRPSRLLIGRVLLFPVAIGYKLGVVSASRGRQFAVRLAFRGEDAASVRRCGVEYATRVLPRTLRPWTLERIALHQSRGDDVVVVSAALEIYLGPWCERRRLTLICTTLEERQGRLTGEYVHGRDCCGAEKVRRIKERYDLGRYSRVYAYGDSVEDREMLELAHTKFYRGMKISNWAEVHAFDHPTATVSDET